MVLKGFKGEVHRVLFNEITKSAVQEAIKHPGDIDTSKFEAQQARRVLDRLVGYQISPLLWDKVRRGLSAGRVQSVAVRLLVEREREIQGFTSVEYWQITAKLFPGDRDGRAADLRGPPGRGGRQEDRHRRAFAPRPAHRSASEPASDKRFYISDEKQARDLEKRFREARDWKVTRGQAHRAPTPPGTAVHHLDAPAGGFAQASASSRAARCGSPSVCTKVVELGDEGTIGLITYMRTDSTRVSADAQAAALAHIRATFGDAFAPSSPNVYRTKKSAQDAHEAIRPTSLRPAAGQGPRVPVLRTSCASTR